MQSLVLVEPGRLELRQVPMPIPAAGEMLLRVCAATTCGTDLKAWRRGHPQIPMPGPFGHEYSGQVVACGSNAPFEIGTHVMGVHSAPCQDCRWCNAGQENLCESIMQTKVLGAYAEYLLIPERIGRINVFEKPDHVPFPIASLLEPLSCVAQGVLKLQLHGALDQPGKTHALVIGPGAIGLMFVNALLQVGVRRVTLAGRNPDRLDLGQKLGAETIRYSDLPATGDADIVIECTGMPEVWERSTWLTRRGGTVMWFGGCPSGSTVSLDTGRVHYDQITLLSPFHFGTFAVRTAREWLLDAPAKYEGLLSGTRTLAEASETFASLERGEGLKYVFLPGGED